MTPAEAIATPLRIGSLFAGIGGLELGLERAGLGRVAWQVEIDPFCRRVLARHWPEVVRHEDVRSISAATVAPVDIVCGGFPCQDVSLAGKRAGLAGERSGLWSEFRRIIAELTPSIVIVENVLGLRTSGLSRVLADVAALGFDAEWTCFRASDLGAPHGRPRIFIVATHADRVRLRDEPGWLGRACWQATSEHRLDPATSVDPDADGLRRLEQAWRIANERGWSRHVGWELDHPSRMDDGFPEGVDVGRARKALGNAVAVACAETVGRAVLEVIA